MSLEEQSTSSNNSSFFLEMLDKENEYEEADNIIGPVKLLPSDGRVFVWRITKLLAGVQAHQGLASLSCSLFERYLVAFIRKNMSRIDEWHEVKREIREKTMLCVAVCVQLASKTMSVEVHVSTSDVKRLLDDHNKSFSLQDINKIELEIFQGLNFRIPMWSNVEKAQMLASEVGITGLPLEGVGLVMNLADYKRYTLQLLIKAIIYKAVLENGDIEAISRIASQQMDNIRNMHWLGGVVAATAGFFDYTEPDLISKLSRLVRGRPTYIKLIRNVILHELNDRKAYLNEPKKRKLDTVAGACSTKLQRQI